MTKNKSFERKYTINCKGITTNNFLVEFLDSIISNTVLALEAQSKQLEIKLEIKEVK